MTLTKYQLAVQAIVGASWPPEGTITSTLIPDTRFNKLLQMSGTTTSGTGTSQGNTLIVQARQLAVSATETLNFFDGSVADVQGNANGLQNIKSLIIYQIANPDASTDASSFTVGSAGANVLQLNFGATTDTWTGYLNQAPFIAGRPAGYTVDATNKNVKIINNDGSNLLTYILVAVGVKV